MGISPPITQSSTQIHSDNYVYMLHLTQWWDVIIISTGSAYVSSRPRIQRRWDLRRLQHDFADTGHGAEAVGGVLYWQRFVLSGRHKWMLALLAASRCQWEKEHLATQLHLLRRQNAWWHCSGFSTLAWLLHRRGTCDWPSHYWLRSQCLADGDKKRRCNG